eukprot:3914543-Pyramimonas_sp.AAC.1
MRLAKSGRPGQLGRAAPRRKLSGRGQARQCPTPLRPSGGPGPCVARRLQSRPAASGDGPCLH